MPQANSDRPLFPVFSSKALSLVYLLLIGLYFTTWVNYLLFHTLSELFSIVIAFCLFIIATHTRNYIQNSYLLFIGIAYFFIAGLDLLHTLAYKGMPIFTDYDFYANQLWIGARYMESLTLVLASFTLSKNRTINYPLVFFSYAAVSIIIVLSIFVFKVFPECFIDGSGLTPFKKYSEFVICGLLFAALFLLSKSRNSFSTNIYRIIQFSIFFTIISELAFTFYVSNYGFSNLVGHYFKILSFLMIYTAIVKTSLEEPVKIIFHDLDMANAKLKREVEERQKAEQEKEKLIKELQTTLQEIKTLKGIIPICMHCKEIRDDKGSWNQLEKYIVEHSDAEFSHGICEKCLAEKYGKYKK